MKSRAGVIDALFVILGLILAVTIAAMVASQVGQITAAGQTALFIMGVVILALAVAVIARGIAKGVRGRSTHGR